MEYKISQQSPTEHTLTITLSSQEFKRHVTQKALVSAKKMQRKGFRSGQVPLHLVKQMLGQQFYYETAAELAEKEYEAILEKEQLELAGMPELDIVYAEEEKGAECVLAYSTYPEIEVPQWEDLKIDMTQVVLGDDDYQAVIQAIRERSLIWTEAQEEAAADAMRVTLDFEGKIDDVAFPGGTGHDQQLVIGSNSFLPDFEQVLIGMKAGDSKTAPVSFPEDYQSEELAGKTAQFNLHVKKVEASRLPELDEEFFKAQGSQAKTTEVFEKDIQKGIQQHVHSLMSDNRRDACMKALEEAVQFDAPKRLVAQDARQLQQEAFQWLEQNGNKIDAQQKKNLFPLEQFTERATKRVAQWLLFQAVLKTFDFTVTDSDIDQLFQEEQPNQPDHVREQTIVRLRDNPAEKQKIENIILERRVFAAICDAAQVTHTDKPYMEYFNQQS